MKLVATDSVSASCNAYFLTVLAQQETVKAVTIDYSLLGVYGMCYNVLRRMSKYRSARGECRAVCRAHVRDDRGKLQDCAQRFSVPSRRAPRFRAENPGRGIFERRLMRCEHFAGIIRLSPAVFAGKRRSRASGVRRARCPCKWGMLATLWR